MSSEEPYKHYHNKIKNGYKNPNDKELSQYYDNKQYLEIEFWNENNYSYRSPDGIHYEK